MDFTYQFTTLFIQQIQRTLQYILTRLRFNHIVRVFYIFHPIRIFVHLFFLALFKKNRKRWNMVLIATLTYPNHYE